MANLENNYPETEDHGSYLDNNMNGEDALRRIRTTGNISISPELFEKIYLSPKNQVSNNLRSTIGNPTPLALAGFLLSLTPLSNALLGWRGAGGLGAAEIGPYFYFGGLLMVIGSILEFVLGNTFPFVVFGTFGSFWLTYGATLTPYTPDNPNAGATDPTFQATFAFFLLWMGVLCFIYLICSLRTNVVFFLIFLLCVPAFACLAGSFWKGAQGNAATALRLQHAGGGLAFAVCLLGWYLFLVLLLAAVDFPLSLPVGDLSQFIKGASDKKKVP